MTQEWDYQGGRSAWRRWGTRLLALLALAAVLGVLYGIYQAAIAEDEPEPTAISTELDALARAGDRLGTRLDALRPSSKPDAARKAASRTLTATREAGAAYRASDLPDSNAGERIRNALGAEYDFLRSVIEVLEDPGSRAYEDLPERADRARKALAAMPDPSGLPETVRGVDRLRRWASAND